MRWTSWLIAVALMAPAAAADEAGAELAAADAEVARLTAIARQEGAGADAMMALAEALVQREELREAAALARAGDHPQVEVPQPDFREALRWLRAALEAGPPDEGELRYRLAVLLARAGQAKAALEQHLWVDRHTTAKHRRYIENTLALGEHYFAEASFEAALARYRRVQKLAGPLPVAAYAAYKEGWVRFNLGELDASARALRRARRLAGPGAALVAEIDRDLARVWAHQEGGWKRAERFLSSRGSAAEVRVALRRVAAHLEDLGRPEEALEVYRRLLERARRPADREADRADILRLSRELDR